MRNNDGDFELLAESTSSWITLQETLLESQPMTSTMPVTLQ